MLYLVKGWVQYRPYMADSFPEPEEETRIVAAENVWEAQDIFTAHFQSKGQEHGDSYFVSMVEAHAALS